MSSAVTGKGVPVKVPSRSSRLSVLRLVRMAVAFVVVAGSLGLATVAATAQSSGGSCPSDGAPAYSDVPESSFAYDDSRCLREQGISDAVDTYRPGDDMTRSEMAAFMANAYAALTGMEAPVEEHMFTDVEGDPNADDIARISPNGLMITEGTSGTTYSPDAPVVRGHMALFLTRMYKAVTGSDAPAGDTPFTDIGDRPASEQAAIGAIYALDVTTGTSATTYAPHDNVTREQMASFVARMYRAIDALPDPAEAPGAPTALAATPHGTAGTALEVTWSAPEDSGTSDVTGYVVQWGADYNSQRTTTDTTVTISGLTKGTTTSVRVAAVSDDGQGDWATATGMPGTTAGAVADLKAAPGATPGTINVTWSAPADDGGTPLTGYKILYAQGNNARKSMQINNPGATSHTLSGLDSAALYYVWVTATNGAGDGAASGAASATPTGNVASGTVKINRPTVADAGGRFDSVSWPTVTTKPGQVLYHYWVQRKCGNQLWPDEIIPNDSSRIFRHASADSRANQVLTQESASNRPLLGGALSPTAAGTLQNGVECTYRVRATPFVDTDGDESKDDNEPFEPTPWVEGKATPAATTAVSVPAATVVPAAPEGVTAIGGNRSVQVNWTLVPTASQGTGGPVTGYKVTLASSSHNLVNVPVVSATVSATTESHTFTGLNNVWLYRALVVAVNASGDGAEAGTESNYIRPGAAPGAPTNVRVTQGTTRGTTLKVAWNAPASNRLATVTGYTLQQRNSAFGTTAATAWVEASPQPTGTATMVEEVTGLTPGRSYDFRVRSTGVTVADSPANVSGPWSAVVSGTSTNVPGIATNIDVTENDGSLTLEWTPADGMGSKVTSYTLTYVRTTSNTHNPVVSAGSVAASPLPTKTITGLTNGVSYTISIKTHNAQGSSTGSATATGTPAAGGGSLPAPTSVKATVVPVVNDDGTIGARPTINVTWNAVPGATAYVVEWLRAIGFGDSATTLGDPTNDWLSTGVRIVPRTTSANITGLETVNGTYVVRVRAATPLGRYGYSAAVKTERAPSAAPTAVSVVQIVGTTTLRVDWTSLTASAARMQGVTGYKVSWGPTNDQVPGNRGTAMVAAPANAGAGVPMSYNITGLNAIGQPIRVTVAAVNNIGAGAYSAGTYPPPTS